MKLKMILATLMVAASLNAAAEPFYWAGVSAGVNNRDAGTTSTSSSWTGGLLGGGNASETKSNITINAGAGIRLPSPDFDFAGIHAVAMEASLTRLNGKTIAMPQLNYIWQPNGYMTDKTPIIMPHAGYSGQTGATGGVDVLIPLHVFMTGGDQTSVRVGFTEFQKNVDGAKNMIQIGVVRSFY